MSMNDRLKRIEQAIAEGAAVVQNRAVLSLPDNGRGDNEDEIRRRWNRWLETGECPGGVLIVPHGESMSPGHG